MLALLHSTQERTVCSIDARLKHKGRLIFYKNFILNLNKGGLSLSP